LPLFKNSFESALSIQNLSKFPEKRNNFFTINENTIGQKSLVKLGVTSNRPILIFYIRDEKYLDKNIPKKDWSYHDYRNSPVKEFVNLIQVFINLGFTVIRMGNLAKDKVPLTDPNFFDYPFTLQKSDFLDVWIPSISSGIVSTGTGPDTLAILFNKPLMHFNFLPAYSSFYHHNVLVVPKILRLQGKRMSKSKILSCDYTRSEHYVKNSIITETFPSEFHHILANEFLTHLNNKIKVKNVEQIIADGIIETTRMKHKLSTFFHKSARVSNTWLNLFDDFS
jgi:putative glycosyltransferase (TIGR04372 family)